MKNFKVSGGVFSQLFFQLLSLVLLVSAYAEGPNGSAGGDFVPGELVVKLRAGLSEAGARDIFSGLDVQEARLVSGGLSLVRLSQAADLESALASLQANPQVEYAQLNYIVQRDASSPFKLNAASLAGLDFFGSPTKPAILPRPAEIVPPLADPELRQNYNLRLIRATDAWSAYRGSENIIVAVIDSGIDYNHEDLAFNMWRNPNPSEKGDIVGFDFLKQDAFPWDDDEMHGHGTHAAGIIGAVGGNGKGISGINQRVSLMAVKAFSAYGFATVESIVAGINYAVDHGARVLSNSWANASKNNPALVEAIEKARAKGVLFVAAAGNSRGDDDSDTTAEYPAGYGHLIDNIVAVASVDSSDQLAPSSNYGQKTVLLAAPGVNVYSTLPGNKKYGWDSGTSIACPHVAGAAALIWSKHPDWTYLQVKQALAESVDVVPSLSGKVKTSGRLNVWKALQK